ncbi:MAG: hypothetical protein QXR45_08340, partial [Candidatus Bathyarchaeia archaeon]
MRFDEPEEGFFSMTFFWDNNESDPNSACWNFTFISFTAKFSDGSDFSNTLNLSIKKAVPSGFPNNYYRYTVSISEIYGEDKNGEFFVNATLLAAGVANGVCYPHAEGIQNITIVNVRCYENLMSESGPGNCSILTLPLSGIHDVCVESVTCLKSVVGQSMCLIVNVTVFNKGDFTEMFDVRLYANTSIIDVWNINLTIGEFKTVTYLWSTSGFVKGNYTLWAYAWPVPDEINVDDNTFTDGWVFVAMIGDINADGKVDMKDVALVSKAFGSIYIPGQGYMHPTPCNMCPHNPNTDINNDL